jgi:alpha-L-fucosidase
MDIPSHLKGYETLYGQDPRAAALQWFQDAKFGLFVHYTLASLLPYGKPDLLELVADAPHLMNVMEAAPEELAEMDMSDADRARCLAIKQDMMDRFTANKFDADVICDLAEAAQMR